MRRRWRRGGGEKAAGGRLSKGDYEGKLANIGETLTKATEGLSTAVSPKTSPADAAGGIGKLQDALAESADELAELSPPEDIQGAHDNLVEGIRSFADALGDLKAAAEEGDTAKMLEFVGKMAESDFGKKLQEATETLQEKGYKLGD